MIRILVVDQTHHFCNTLVDALADEPDMYCVGSVTSLEEALVLAPHSDIVLVNARLPQDGALTLTRHIRDQQPTVRVLVVGLIDTREEILRYVEAGALGYVLGSDSVEDLMMRIRAAYNGGALISPTIAAVVLSRLAQLAQRSNKPDISRVNRCTELTRREREVLTLLEQGLSNVEIAERLVVEMGTVKNHVHHILKKLNLTSRHDAAAYWAVVR